MLGYNLRDRKSKELEPMTKWTFFYIDKKGFFRRKDVWASPERSIVIPANCLNLTITNYPQREYIDNFPIVTMSECE